MQVAQTTSRIRDCQRMSGGTRRVKAHLNDSAVTFEFRETCAEVSDIVQRDDVATSKGEPWPRW